jgi:hypothetical protein
MKHTPSARLLRRQALLSIYINERLTQLEQHPDTEAETFYREIQQAMGQAGICWAETQVESTPLLSGIAAATITMVPDTAAVEDMVVAEPVIDTAKKAEDILKQIRLRQSAAAAMDTAEPDYTAAITGGTDVNSQV